MNGTDAARAAAAGSLAQAMIAVPVDIFGHAADLIHTLGVLESEARARSMRRWLRAQKAKP
jgi:hypothetical protein